MRSLAGAILLVAAGWLAVIWDRAQAHYDRKLLILSCFLVCAILGAVLIATDLLPGLWPYIKRSAAWLSSIAPRLREPKTVGRLKLIAVWGGCVMLILSFVLVAAVFWTEPVTWSKEEKESMYHFQIARERIARVYQFGRARPKDKPLSNEETAYVVSLWDSTAREAKGVKEAALLKAHPDLPVAFRGLVHGIESCLQGDAHGWDLCDQWEDWLQVHAKDIKMPDFKFSFFSPLVPEPLPPADRTKNATSATSDSSSVK
jgi:hypothetical protein